MYTATKDDTGSILVGPPIFNAPMSLATLPDRFKGLVNVTIGRAVGDNSSSTNVFVLDDLVYCNE